MCFPNTLFRYQAPAWSSALSFNNYCLVWTWNDNHFSCRISHITLRRVSFIWLALLGMADWIRMNNWPKLVNFGRRAMGILLNLSWTLKSGSRFKAEAHMAMRVCKYTRVSVFSTRKKRKEVSF
jgi:hypothetical protein